jgi:hypothetical protein
MEGDVKFMKHLKGSASYKSLGISGIIICNDKSINENSLKSEGINNSLRQTFSRNRVHSAKISQPFMQLKDSLLYSQKPAAYNNKMY